MKKKTNNEIQMKFQRSKKFKRIEMFGGKCVCCGEDRTEMLIVIFEKKYVIRCRNCKMAKQMYGACPHELERKMDYPARRMIEKNERERVEKTLAL